MKTPHHCPDCGLRAPPPPDGAPFVCSACLAATPARPPEGWPVEDRWVGPGRGRGVFASRDLAPTTLVERCWVMPIPPAEAETSLKMPVVNRYLFPWPGDRRAVISGAGLLYNFDRTEVTGRSPNLLCVVREGLSAIEFWTTRAVGRGEELTWDYQRAQVLRGPPK